MRYFLHPTKLRWSRKEKAPRPRAWVYSQTRSTGPERPTPLHLEPTTLKTATHLARSRSVRIGVVRFEKILVAILSAKRQHSVAKLSAKRIFSLAKRDFLVANGRMAADFSSPAVTNVGSPGTFRRNAEPKRPRRRKTGTDVDDPRTWSVVHGTTQRTLGPKVTRSSSQVWMLFETETVWDEESPWLTWILVAQPGLRSLTRVLAATSWARTSFSVQLQREGLGVGNLQHCSKRLYGYG